MPLRKPLHFLRRPVRVLPEIEQGNGSRLWKSRAPARAGRELLKLGVNCMPPSLPIERNPALKTLTGILLAAAIVSTLAGPASAQKPPPGQPSMSGKMDPAMMQQMMQKMMPSPGDSASTKELKEAHMKMMHGMNAEFTGNPGVDFRNNMIPHHQGAIDMARVALKYAKDSETRTLAEKIIKAQEKEIADMRAWLKKNRMK